MDTEGTSSKKVDNVVVFMGKRSESELPAYIARLQTYVDFYRKYCRAAGAGLYTEKRKKIASRQRNEVKVKNKDSISSYCSKCRAAAAGRYTEEKKKVVSKQINPVKVKNKSAKPAKSNPRSKRGREKSPQDCYLYQRRTLHPRRSLARQHSGCRRRSCCKRSRRRNRSPSLCSRCRKPPRKPRPCC